MTISSYYLNLLSLILPDGVMIFLILTKANTTSDDLLIEPQELILKHVTGQHMIEVSNVHPCILTQ